MINVIPFRRLSGNWILCVLLCCASLGSETAVNAQATTPANVPTASAVESVTKLISGIYKADYEAAKTPLQKQALAKKLRDDARKTNDDATARFAMFQVARKIAIGIGDIDLTLQLTGDLAANYQLQRSNEIQDVFDEFSRKAKNANDFASLLRYMGRELTLLLKANQLVAAQSLVEQGLATAKKSKDPDLTAQWTRQNDRVLARAQAWEKAQAANKVLETKPGDGPANASVGKYACYYQNDWERGLPMLALGDESPTAKLAEQELKGSANASEQLAMTDAWYEYAQKQIDIEKLAILRRCHQHYRRVVPQLTALAQKRVENKVRQIADATCPFVQDEWTEILDDVEFPKHLFDNQWQWEGLSVVTRQKEHWKQFRLPVEIDGDYELRIRATKLAGSDGLIVGLAKPANYAEFLLACYDGKVSGICLVNGHEPDSDQNPSRVAAKELPTGRSFQLTLQVANRGDQVQVTSLVENVRYSRWAGPVAALKPFRSTWTGSLFIRHCGAGMEIQSVQLKLKSGAAWFIE